MKSKTGLHKKVAFIFDGTPTSSQPSAAAPAAAPGPTPESGSVPSTYGPQPIPVTAPAKSNPPKASPKSPGRPGKSAAGASGKQKKMDPKQLKMLVLVGVLSVVLVGVIFFVLSSPAAPPKKAAAGTAAQTHSAAPAAGPVAWTRPEPWPKQIRDPMTTGIQARTNEESGSECLVRGIVYSQTRPSAIVGDQIVFVGDTLNGITITAIGKDFVEFERDGQRWTQQVQR